MNGYIIDPAIFYWINTLSGLKGVSLAFTILGGITALTFGIMSLICMDMIHTFPRNSKEESATLLVAKKWFKISSIVTMVFAILTVFIPDRDTMIYMMVAKLATYENAELTVDAIKSIVDYIISAIDSLK